VFETNGGFEALCKTGVKVIFNVQKMKKFPSRTKRNCSISKAKESFEQSGGAGETGLGAEVAAAEVGGGARETAVLAGRIIGILDDGFVLQDESGRVDIESREKVNVGDIVEVKVSREKRLINNEELIINNRPSAENGFLEQNFFIDKGVFLLASCSSDFFVGKSSPNYLKCVIDVNFREKLRMRSLLIGKIREFFVSDGFLDVETPELVRRPGMEPHLDVFKTRFRSWQAEGGEQDMYLITSPEYAMKKLLVAGFEKVFQICKSFRNKEHLSELHNPEFTMIEWYRAYASYLEIMEDTERLVSGLAKFVNGKEEILWGGGYGGASADENGGASGEKAGAAAEGGAARGAPGGKKPVDVSLPWPRVKVKDLFKEMSGIDEDTLTDIEALRAAVSAKGYKVDEKTPYEDLFYEVFMKEIEPKLGLEKPVIVYDYPVQMAALAKRSADDPRFAERFEVYIAGLELCNAFTELNDLVEQKARLEAERLDRQKMGKDDYEVDQSFIDALAFGMPPAGGIALGVDRLVMLILGVTDINDVLFFPHRDL
jgi:lysyl-tRNA synthetase class 2